MRLAVAKPNHTLLRCDTSQPHTLSNFEHARRVIQFHVDIMTVILTKGLEELTTRWNGSLDVSQACRDPNAILIVLETTVVDMLQSVKPLLQHP